MVLKLCTHTCNDCCPVCVQRSHAHLTLLMHVQTCLPKLLTRVFDHLLANSAEAQLLVNLLLLVSLCDCGCTFALQVANVSKHRSRILQMFDCLKVTTYRFDRRLDCARIWAALNLSS